MIAFWTKLACAIAVLGTLAGCAAANAAMGGNNKQAAQANANWDYGADGVVLDIVADAALNFYAGQSHTVLLGVYQLPDAAPFRDMMTDPTAAAQSLDTGKAGDGVVSLARYVIPPGGRSIIKLERAQKTKFVGISVGYFGLDAKAMRVFQVPLAFTKKGLISNTYEANPAVLMLQLRLGPEGIVEAKQIEFGPAQQRLLDTPPGDATRTPRRLPVPDPAPALAPPASTL